MNWLSTILVLGAAFLAVFWSAAFHGVRHLLGAQIDLLPAVMVYASLHSSLTIVSLTAVLGGLWFDSLSANPLGITVFPLLGIGLLIYSRRDLILRDQVVAQLALGFGASLGLPLMTLLILLTMGRDPLVGLGTLWQLVVMSVGGAVATPILFEILNWLQRVLGYRTESSSSFRPDREIRRGRT